MQTHIWAAAALGLGLSAALPAQAPEDTAVPKILMVVREQIKEGREAAHVQSEESWPRLFEKANLAIHYIGMSSISGPPEAWFLEPYDSLAAMEKAHASMDTSSVAGELAMANAADGELRTGSRTWITAFRPDLSYHAGEAMSVLPKCREMDVMVMRIKFGHEADLAQAAKMLINGDQLSSSDQPVLAYELISGGADGTYLFFAPMDSLARMDEAPTRSAAAHQAMGAQNRGHFESLIAESVQSTESLLFAFNPHMSHVSQEFAAQDPGFWNPKPKAAAKPVRSHAAVP
ncbi:MAG: hypothetical protein ABSH50_30640 [Bryobacteraceae bacterium]|jgi:hypothetical protein